MLAAAVLALVVGGLLEIAPASRPYQRTIDRGYATLASSVSAQSNATGRALAVFMAGAPSLERATFFSTLDDLAAQAAAQSDALESSTPPSPAAGAGADCQSAMAGRASALAHIRQALQGLLGGSTGTAPLAMGSAFSGLESADSTLTQSDARWAACRRALRRSPGRPVLARSQWITDPRTWSPLALTELVDDLVLSPTLLAHPALDLTAIDIVPAPLPGPGPAQVPATDQLTVHAVVSDAGNVDEPGIAVRAELTGSNGSDQQLSAIVGVAAGRSLAVVLGPFAVMPGSSYTLDVSVAPPSGPGAASAATAVQVLSVPTTTTTTTTTTVPHR